MLTAGSRCQLTGQSTDWRCGVQTQMSELPFCTDTDVDVTQNMPFSKLQTHLVLKIQQT